MLRGVREAFEKEGFQVIGACLSGKAAQGLEQAQGSRAQRWPGLSGAELRYPGMLGVRPDRLTEAKPHPIERGCTGVEFAGRPVRALPKTVLVVDEAGMVGTRQMERLTEEALKAGARLFLSGTKGSFSPSTRAAHSHRLATASAATLTEIQRQREEWAREVVKKFASAQVGQAALRSTPAAAWSRSGRTGTMPCGGSSRSGNGKAKATRATTSSSLPRTRTLRH